MSAFNKKLVDPNEYVELAARTDAPLTAELIHRLTNPLVIELLHATLGMVTEAAELADMLKKHIYANKPLDLVNVAEEAGDELWYVAKAIRALRSDMAAIMTMNIEKLRLRYPEKFSEQHSAERDVEAERAFLEHTANKGFVQKENRNFFGADWTKEMDLSGQIQVTPLKNLSRRGEDWIKFSNEVLNHIENYTVPQYGDKGQDQVTEWTADDCLQANRKYAARFRRGARQGEQHRDFLKMAHYVSLTAEKYEEEGGK